MNEDDRLPPVREWVMRWREQLHDEAAYLGRYGHQPQSEIGRMTGRKRDELIRALSRLVGRENKG